MTFYDLCKRLRTLDEITLLEVLEINSEDLVDRFEDLISKKMEMLVEDLGVDDVFDDDRE
jgi:hypothetical protein